MATLIHAIFYQWNVMDFVLPAEEFYCQKIPPMFATLLLKHSCFIKSQCFCCSSIGPCTPGTHCIYMFKVPPNVLKIAMS